MLYNLLACMHLFKVPPHAAWFLWLIVAQWTVVPLVCLGAEVLTAWVTAFVDVQGLVTAQH